MFGYILHINTGSREVSISKDIHIRVNDSVYKKLKMAAEGQHRSISTFMEYTALSHLDDDAQKQDDITSLEQLARSLKDEIKGKRKNSYKVVA